MSLNRRRENTVRSFAGKGHGPSFVRKRLARAAAALDENLSWYVVVTASRCEDKVSEGLIRLGFSAYVPKENWRVVNRLRKVDVERPAIPRYIFCGLPRLNPPFGAVHSVDGLERLLGTDGKPQSVPVAALRLLDAGLCEGAAEPASLVGQTMQVADGPFQGFFALVTGVMSGDRVRAVIAAFGSSTVEMAAESLRAA